MVIQKLAYLLALLTYHTIHSISLVLIPRKKRNLFVITSSFLALNLLGLQVLHISQKSFFLLLQQKFIQYLALVFSYFHFPTFSFKKYLTVFRKISIYNYQGFTADNNVICYVLNAQPLPQPFTGKGHKVHENLHPSHSVHPIHHFCLEGGGMCGRGGLTSYQVFKKTVGCLTGSQGKEGVTFFRSCNFYIKNKVKSEVISDKIS